MSTKQKYRIRNWKEYNKALVERGSIYLHFDEAILPSWHSQAQSTKRGRPFLYTDEAIKCALLIKIFFHLPLRATEGFISSLIRIW
jgi:hypothetical protein